MDSRKVLLMVPECREFGDHCNNGMAMRTVLSRMVVTVEIDNSEKENDAIHRLMLVV